MAGLADTEMLVAHADIPAMVQGSEYPQARLAETPEQSADLASPLADHDLPSPPGPLQSLSPGM